MKRRYRLWRTVAAILVAVTFARSVRAAEPSGDRDIAEIKSRLVAQYAAGPFDQASRNLETQQSDGSWADIRYDDRSLNWDPQKHLDRLKQMAIAYRNSRSPEHGSPKLRDGVARGLAFWVGRKPVADDWWHTEIGQQLIMEPILILMDGDIPPQLITAGTAYLHDPVERASFKFTGQNLIWSAGEQLVRGALRQSPDDITKAVQAMASVAAVTAEAEGIQYDHSFHQHGPQLYVGGYGINLLKDETASARLFAGTRFAFPKERIDVLADYLLDGARLMVRGKMLDASAIGRDISRPGSSQEALGLLAPLDAMTLLKPERKQEFEALRAHIQGSGASYGFLGHKHFWNSDFTVHQRAGYYGSVKMVSSRTYGTELVNGENLKGYWLPFGLTTIVRRGDEYLDIYPVWDWTHLPGVTSTATVPRFLSHVDQRNTFVGGVSDGVYGASAMKIDVEAGTSIHAEKAWFFFDDEIVAIGAGISSRSDPRVTTTLNQSLQHGAAVADGRPIGAGERTLPNASWVFHDGIGYVFPQKASVVVATGARSGSWSDINALQAKSSISKDVFTLWLDHGTHPTGGDYQYIIVPDTDAARLAGYAAHIPVRVLANTIAMQAVRHERLDVTGIIFYAPGHLTLDDGLVVGVDQPAMLMLQKAGAGLKLTASSPRGPTTLHVSLKRATATKDVAFDLRGGPSLGASHVQTVEGF